MYFDFGGWFCALISEAEGEYNENADYWDGDPNSLLQKSSLNDEEDLDDDDFLDESDDEVCFKFRLSIV